MGNLLIGNYLDHSCGRHPRRPFSLMKILIHDQESSPVRKHLQGLQKFCFVAASKEVVPFFPVSVVAIRLQDLHRQTSEDDSKYNCQF